MDEIRIEYVSLSEVIRWPRNPKDHDTLAIQKSINRFGFVQPILLDEKTGKLMAGHGRLDTLTRMKELNLEPPLRIEEVDGVWKVPVIRGISFGNEAEAEAYLLADNRLSEIGGWRQDVLTGILQEMVDTDESLLEGIGFELDEVLAMKSVDSERKPTLEELESQYGEHRDKDFWPIVKVKVSPAVKAKFETLLEIVPGEDDSEKFFNIIENAELRMFGEQ